MTDDKLRSDLTIQVVCNQYLEIQKDNGMAAMLDDKTKRSVIQHGCHTTVFWMSRFWLQTMSYSLYCNYISDASLLLRIYRKYVHLNINYK